MKNILLLGTNCNRLPDKNDEQFTDKACGNNVKLVRAYTMGDVERVLSEGAFDATVMRHALDIINPSKFELATRGWKRTSYNSTSILLQHMIYPEYQLDDTGLNQSLKALGEKPILMYDGVMDSLRGESWGPNVTVFDYTRKPYGFGHINSGDEFLPYWLQQNFADISIPVS